MVTELVREKMNKEYALVAITKQGIMTAKKLQQGLSGSVLFYPKKLAEGGKGEEGIQLYEGSTKELLTELFAKYPGIILFIALGAVVRMIAPLLQDKKADPALVVVDGKGEFAISVASGHLGGANQLTRKIADLLGATPVITTASDVQKTLSVDLLGSEFGFIIEDFTNVTKASAAIVNEDSVALVQEVGDREWLHTTKLPTNIDLYPSLAELKTDKYQAVLLITDRLLSVDEERVFRRNGVLYRPKSLCVGIGCNRGTSAQEIEEAIMQTLVDLNLSYKSVRNLATIDIKLDELGLLEISRKYDWELVSYSAAELNQLPLKNPSEIVFQHTGAYGVSEPAAMLSAGTEELIIEKRKLGNVTLSIARMKLEGW